MTFKEFSAGQGTPANDTTGAKAKPAPAKDVSATSTTDAPLAKTPPSATPAKS